MKLRFAATLGVGQATGRGAVALALLLLIRVLSETEYGNLAFVLAVTAILITVADGGFARLLVRDMAREKGDPALLVGRLMRVRFAGVLATALVAAVAFPLVLDGFSGRVTLLAVIYLLCEATSFGFENAAVGAERPWRFVLAQSAGGGALLAGVGALLAQGSASLEQALAVFAAAGVVKLAGHLATWRPPGREDASSRGSARALWREAAPFLLLALLATVYYRVGVIALHTVRGPEETASYAAAIRIVDVVAVLAGLAFAAISPSLSRAHRDDPRVIWATWVRYVRLSVLAVVPAAVMLALVAPWLCGVLFGADYGDSAGADLRWLAPGIALLIPQAASAAVVFMGDSHRNVLVLTSVNVAVSVVSSIGLSAAFGSVGTAAALSLAEALSFASFALLISRQYRPRPAPEALTG